MTRYNWASVEREQLNPLFRRQAIHGEMITVARIELAKGCIVPEHAHLNEQISIVKQGRLVFRIAGSEMTLEAGTCSTSPRKSRTRSKRSRTATSWTCSRRLATTGAVATTRT